MPWYRGGVMSSLAGGFAQNCTLSNKPPFAADARLREEDSLEGVGYDDGDIERDALS